MSVLLVVWLGTLVLVSTLSAVNLATPNESLMLATFVATLAFWFEFLALLVEWVVRGRQRSQAVVRVSRITGRLSPTGAIPK